jgi:hypothetical protein
MLFYPLGIRSKEDSDKMLVKLRGALGDENPYSPNSFYPSFDRLPNVKRMTENDLWWHLNSTTPKAYVWCGRQNNKIEIDGKADWRDLTIFWDDRGTLDNGGYAVLWCYNEKSVHYFTWCKCDHTFTSRNTGNCLTLYTCTKCGAAHEIDSSG